MGEQQVKRVRCGAGATALLVAALVGPLAAQGSAWRVDGGEVSVRCPLTVGGSFEARTSMLSGDLGVDPSRPAVLNGALSVDLASLDTGIALRNRHLRENYLEVQKGDGFDRAVLSEIALEEGSAAEAGGKTAFTGVLALHGTRRPVSGEARIERTRSGVRVEASFPVALPEFGIAKPRYLGVGVRDEVQVTVRFQAVGTVEHTR